MRAASSETVRSSERGESLSTNLDGPSQSVDSLPHELKRKTPVVMMQAKLRQPQSARQQPDAKRTWRLNAPKIIMPDLAVKRSMVMAEKV